jgi:hypothetical protein
LRGLLGREGMGYSRDLEEEIVEMKFKIIFG